MKLSLLYLSSVGNAPLHRQNGQANTRLQHNRVQRLLAEEEDEAEIKELRAPSLTLG